MQDNTFTAIPNCLLEKAALTLTAPAFRIYTLLWRYRNAKNGLAWPSQETLATLIGCKRWTVNRCIREIVATGFARKQRRPNNSSEYSVTTEVANITQPDGSVKRHTTGSVKDHTPEVCKVTQPLCEKSHTITPKTITKDKREAAMSSEIENDARRKALAHMWRWYTENVQKHQDRDPDPKEYDEKFIDGIIAANVSTDYAHRCKVAPYLIDIAFFEVVWPFTIERPTLRSIHTHRARLVDAYWEHRDERWPVLFTPEERETK